MASAHGTPSGWRRTAARVERRKEKHEDSEVAGKNVFNSGLSAREVSERILRGIITRIDLQRFLECGARLFPFVLHQKCLA